MVKKDPARKRYPSDLTDEQWAIVAPLIPPAKSGPRGGHPRQVVMREVLNTLFGSVSKVEVAILHRLSKGIAIHKQADHNVMHLR